MRRLVFAIGLISAAAVVRADTLTTINFDTVPALTTGTNLYQYAGAAETIVVPGAATIDGGVVLGLGSFLSGVPGVTAPNIYGTASDNVIGYGGFGLGDAIVINIPVGLVANQATVPVINGLLTPVSYLVTAFDGSAQLAQQLLTDIPPFQSFTARLAVPGITSITITPVDSRQWDFATDTIALVENSDPGGKQISSFTPEPGSIGLTLAGIAGICMLSLFRLRTCDGH